MKLVSNWNDIRRNLIQLDEYYKSKRSGDHVYFRDRMARGHGFVVFTHGNERIFGPSRFLGYQGNTRSKHEANEDRHGGETNNRIEKILGCAFQPSGRLEAEFLRFCNKRGIQASRNHRTYIDYDNIQPLNDYAELLKDIRRLDRVGPTQRKQLVFARLGQGRFRDDLDAYWRGRCAVTGCATTRLLRASHIKPWRACTNAERLDPNNGLLLSPNLDAAFDRGLISFDVDGRILISDSLSAADCRALGIRNCQIKNLTAQHQVYLTHHRKEFLKQQG